MNAPRAPRTTTTKWPNALAVTLRDTAASLPPHDIKTRTGAYFALAFTFTLTPEGTTEAHAHIRYYPARARDDPPQTPIALGYDPPTGTPVPGARSRSPPAALGVIIAKAHDQLIDFHAANRPLARQWRHHGAAQNIYRGLALSFPWDPNHRIVLPRRRALKSARLILDEALTAIAHDLEIERLGCDWTGATEPWQPIGLAIGRDPLTRRPFAHLAVAETGQWRPAHRHALVRLCWYANRLATPASGKTRTSDAATWLLGMLGPAELARSALTEPHENDAQKEVRNDATPRIEWRLALPGALVRALEGEPTARELRRARSSPAQWRQQSVGIIRRTAALLLVAP